MAQLRQEFDEKFLDSKHVLEGQGLHKQSKNEKWDLSPESQKSMKYCNSFQLLCTCKNPVVLTVKACRLGIRQENFFHL